MASQTMVTVSEAERASTVSFDRFAGYCGIAAGVGGIIYSLAFVVLKSPLLYSLALLVSGLLTTVLLVALYGHLRATDPGFALLGLLTGLVGSMGSAIHGGYDLSNAINVPDSDPLSLANLPSQVDPRGLLTFGLAGLGLMTISWLMTRNATFPKSLGYLGYALSVLMIVIYLVRLIILDPNKSPLILVVLALTGFIISPAWYIWSGMVLSRGKATKS